MRNLIAILLFSTIISTQISSQEHLEVEGSARIKQDLTVEGLAGNGTRNVVADTNGKLIIEAKKQGVISIPAESFLEINNTPTNYQRILDFIPIGGSQSYVAPIQLPHGATLDSIKIFYIDNSMDNDIDVNLEGFDASINTIYTLASIQSSGTPSAPLNNRVSITTGISAMPIVDNANFTYRMFIRVLDEWDPFVLGVGNIHIFYTEQ